MTFSELRTFIADYLNRQDLTDTQLDHFIKQAESEFQRVIRHRKMVKRVTANVDSHFTNLPTDFLQIINAQINTTPKSILRQASMETADQVRLSNGDVTGRPEYYAIVGETLELVPRPDAEVELELTYYEKIPALSASNTTNWLLDDYQDIYIYGVLKQALVFLMEDERLPTMAALYTSAVAALNEEQESFNYGAGSLTMKRRTYGGSHNPRPIYRGN